MYNVMANKPETNLSVDGNPQIMIIIQCKYTHGYMTMTMTNSLFSDMSVHII